jgi:hypothetical protein
MPAAQTYAEICVNFRVRFAVANSILQHEQRGLTGFSQPTKKLRTKADIVEE